MSIDGFFQDDHQVIYRYRWKTKLLDEEREIYRLEKVTYQPGALGMPPVDIFLNYDALPQNMIVLTEKGGGLTTFATWLEENASEPWRLFSLRNMTERDIKNRNDLLAGVAGNYILDRMTHQDMGERFPENQGDLARIGAFVETNAWREGNIRLVSIAYMVENLEEDTLFSTFFHRSDAYRLPQFNEKEILGWLEVLLDRYPSLSSTNLGEVADYVRSAIGGQPKLMHSLFRLVDDRLSQEKDGGLSREVDLLSIFQRIVKRIQDNPPNVVNRWKRELKALLHVHPERRALLEKYAMGHVKPGWYDYTEHDTTLYLAGWLSMDAIGKWGIRSDCHRQWAIDVLRGDI